MSRFRKWVLKIAFKVLKEKLENGEFKEEFITAVNDNIDLPGFNEEEEQELFGVLYETFADIGLEFLSRIGEK